MVAGGIGVTPFLSILRELCSDLSQGRNGYPDRIQLLYTIKKSQDVCLLDPILPQLLDIKQFHINLQVFVTQENQTGTTLKEVLNSIPEAQITNFRTDGTSYAAHGSERLVPIAAITMVSSIIFLLSLVFFNHFVIPPAKKLSEEKKSSSEVDLLFLCSFGLAIIFAALVAIMIRWKRQKKEVQLFSDRQSKGVKQSSLEANRDLDEHRIHFGGRPNFQGTVSFTLRTDFVFLYHIQSNLLSVEQTYSRISQENLGDPR